MCYEEFKKESVTFPVTSRIQMNYPVASYGIIYINAQQIAVADLHHELFYRFRVY